MKLTTIIIILFISTFLFAEIETGACEGFHMTGAAGLYILSDCLTEWLDLPGIVPFIFVGMVCVGKEMFDPKFSMNDIKWDAIGIGIGFSVRFVDRMGR